MQTTLNLVVLKSPDADASASFYRMLGIEFTKHRHGSGPEHYAADLGGCIFEIYPSLESESLPQVARMGFRIEGLDELVERLASAGTVIARMPAPSQWGYRAVVVDPDGVKVEITDPNR